MFLKLACKSLIDRRGAVLLTVLAMTVSVFVLFSVEHIRAQAKKNFSSTVSGVDLIVGARTGSLNLLLYSVFRIGSPTNNISWDAYKKISSNRMVSWAIPISLGDSHKGYSVVGTSSDYFTKFKYGQQHALTFSHGEAFSDLFDVVLGAEVARKLNYRIGSELTLSHGTASTSFSQHDDLPFTVVGILAPTGTPVDRSLHVSLAAIEAIHVGWQSGTRLPSNQRGTPIDLQQADLTPDSITAVLVGMNSRMTIFRVQRDINTEQSEPLTAIIPGVALSELWQMMGVLENTLRSVAMLVFVASILGLSAMLLSSVRNRVREIHLLRIVGASPVFVFLLIELEALLITILSLICGAFLLVLLLTLGQDILVEFFGLHIGNNIISANTILYSLAILGASAVIAIVPAASAFRVAIMSNTRLSS